MLFIHSILGLIIAVTEKKSEKLMSNDWEDSDEEVPAPPPPPRITKISIGFTKPKEPIKMTLGGAKASVSTKKPSTVASVFNADDDDDEPEEMPAEARMRMRNIGRCDTYVILLKQF